MRPDCPAQPLFRKPHVSDKTSLDQSSPPRSPTERSARPFQEFTFYKVNPALMEIILSLLIATDIFVWAALAT